MNTDDYALSPEEWEAVTDYVTGHASPEATAAMQVRLAADPAFAAYLAPMLALWKFPPPASHVSEGGSPSLRPATSPANTERTQAAWARFEAALAALPEDIPASAPSEEVTPPSPLSGSSAKRKAPARRWIVRHRWWTVAGIAALLIIGANVRFWLTNPAFQYVGGKTGRLVTLPDDSYVQLAPGAYLGTSHRFLHGNRSVYLYGHAQFKVAPDPANPFVVHVIGIQAKALGTNFGMTSDTVGRVQVEVSQGKVVLFVLGADGVRRPMAVLTAGEVQQIPVLTRWLTETGAVLGAAGVPLDEAIHVHNVLLRAAAAMAR